MLFSIFGITIRVKISVMATSSYAIGRQGAVEKEFALKGLCHTVATIPAEMGMDERTITGFLGRKTIDMARYYARCY